MHTQQTVTLLKALADPTRLQLVKDLGSCPTGVKPCSELSAKQHLSQPAMSHHFAKLVAAGVVSESKAGTQKQYKLNKELLEAHGIYVDKLI
jgi:ArsR family transcriptional regulator, arsenate/arsenite/antimonite-responsive transcriptional repressor